jgi:hypothetical protein
MKCFYIFASAASLLIAIPAIAQPLYILNAAPASVQNLSNETQLTAQATSPSPSHAANLGDIEVLDNNDWRSRDAHIPWSKPVIVQDDFDGNYLAVFDRNFTRTPTQEQAVVSNWSRKYIRVYVYNNTRQCGAFALVCRITRTETFEAKSLDIRIGDKLFKLTGSDGNFPVDDELAQALAQAPVGETRVRVSLEESGAVITSDIGAKTVDAWKTVYADAIAQQ